MLSADWEIDSEAQAKSAAKQVQVSHTLFFVRHTHMHAHVFIHSLLTLRHVQAEGGNEFQHVYKYMKRFYITTYDSQNHRPSVKSKN